MLEFTFQSAVFSSLCIVFLFILIHFSIDKMKALFSHSLNTFHKIIRKSTFIHSVSKIFLKRQASRSLPSIKSFEKVSDRVFRILGQNPGSHTLQGTNTYLVTGQDESIRDHIIIDTGEDFSAQKYLDVLFNEVFPLSKTRSISKILLTHGHGDHIGGVLPLIERLKKNNMLPLPKIYKRNIPFGNYPVTGFECIDIKESRAFTIGSDTTIVPIFTPGHTDDHVSFILKEDKAIFTGDCVLGCGTSVFDDLHDYMNSLNKLKAYISNNPMNIHLENIYPGHGLIIHGQALEKVDEYIHHRIIRERQIIDALKGSTNWISSWELVPRVYGELSMDIKLSAQWNLHHHLSKLRKEEKVIEKWPDLWKLNEIRSFD